MLRLKFEPKANRPFFYRNSDLVRDAVANMLIAAGAPAEHVLGYNGGHWAAGVVFGGKLPRDRNVRRGLAVLVSTTDPVLSECLARGKPEEIFKAQESTGEILNMAGASVTEDLDPVIPGMTSFIDARCITPICISRKGHQSGRKWHDHILDCDVSAAVNSRLSRIAGRPVALNVVPDDEYLATHERHSVSVAYKETSNARGKHAAVIVGLTFPFVLYGSAEDLKLAWYAGLGERNRQGFGLIGLA